MNMNNNASLRIALYCLLLIIFLFLTMGCAPTLQTLVYNKANGVYSESEEVIQPDESIIELHSSLDHIVDLHADTLQFVSGDFENDKFRRLLKENKDEGHVDVPRLIKGNVSLQVFSVFTKGTMDTFFPEKLIKCGQNKKDRCSRQSISRDPDVAAYDDPDHPYQDEAFYLPLDPVVYLNYLYERPSHLWHQGTDEVWRFSGTKLSSASVDEYIREHNDYLTNRVHVERALWTAKTLDSAAELSSGRLRLVRSKEELEKFYQDRGSNGKIVAGMLSMEGMYLRGNIGSRFKDLEEEDCFDLPISQQCLEKDPGFKQIVQDFYKYFNAGFRMMSLTHFIDNDWGGSSTGVKKGGVTEAGKALIKLMLTHGVIIDVAHASPKLMRYIVKEARGHKTRIVYSHGGLSELMPEHFICNGVRNITDAQIRDIASTGGVIGVGYDAHFVCGNDPIYIAEAIRHAIDVIDREPKVYYKNNDGNEILVEGVNHVSLGSDYDGGIVAFASTDHLYKLTEALVRICKKSGDECLKDTQGNPIRFFTDEDIEKIMGKNSYELLRVTLPDKNIQ